MNGSESITADECLASGVTGTPSGDRASPSASRVQSKGSPRDRWRGHSPITHEVLLSILLRAAAGEQLFTRDERILYTVCEFWAAIQAQSIIPHLGSKPGDNLQSAVAAFSAIGATHLASLLNAVRNDLATAPTTKRPLRRLAALQNELSKILDPVDYLIARYARDVKSSSSLPPSGIHQR